LIKINDMTSFHISNLKFSSFLGGGHQFPDDTSAQKGVYLAIMNIEKKWNVTLHNWGLVLHQFMTIFEDRCRL